MTAYPTLPLSGLRIDKANVRTIGRELDPELQASIEAIGVKVPLIVRPNGTGHMVLEGGRRLLALQALAKAGKIKTDHPVPVIIEEQSDAAAREISLAVNLNRLAMHPVDEFRAFHTLHSHKENPLTVEQIALRFGIDKKAVQQRLALGALSDNVLAAWRDDEIDQETAQAFTLCSDKKRQGQILVELRDRHQLNHWTVRATLRGNERDANRLLKIVGQPAYEARGGKVTIDLFGDDHVVSDPALLKTMFEEHVASFVEKLKADGWSFVVTERPENYHSWETIEPKVTLTEDEKKQRKALEAKLQGDEYEEEDEEALNALDEAARVRSFTAKHKAASGCIVLTDGTEFEVAYGVVPPKKVAEKLGKEKPDAPKEKKPAALSNALKDRVRLMYLKGTKAALLADKQAGKLPPVLASIVAQQIDTNRAFGTTHIVDKALPAIRAAITPKVLLECQVKAFDAADYFGGAPKSFTLKAIAEAVSPAEAKKLAGKTRAVIAKFAIGTVGKTNWLPKELRTK